MEVLFSIKRASDGLVKEKKTETTSLKDSVEGAEIFIKNKSILGYCFKDFKTGKILAKKGDI